MVRALTTLLLITLFPVVSEASSLVAVNTKPCETAYKNLERGAATAQATSPSELQNKETKLYFSSYSRDDLKKLIARYLKGASETEMIEAAEALKTKGYLPPKLMERYISQMGTRDTDSLWLEPLGFAKEEANGRVIYRNSLTRAFVSFDAANPGEDMRILTADEIAKIKKVVLSNGDSVGLLNTVVRPLPGLVDYFDDYSTDGLKKMIGQRLKGASNEDITNAVQALQKKGFLPPELVERYVSQMNIRSTSGLWLEPVGFIKQESNGRVVYRNWLTEASVTFNAAQPGDRLRELTASEIEAIKELIRKGNGHLDLGDTVIRPDVVPD